MKRIFTAAALLAYVSLGASAASAHIYNFTEIQNDLIFGSFNIDDKGSDTPGICCGMSIYPTSSATGQWAGVDVNLLVTDSISGFFDGKNGRFNSVISWALYDATPANTGLGGTTSLPIFIPGTYTGLNWYTGDPATMVISAVSGPSAPAPLAGTGLMSALAALAAFAMTRLIGRKGALA